MNNEQNLQNLKAEYRVLYQSYSDEIIEKKSRFIGYTYPVESEEEAAAYIESVKKQHWDARHHCYAYTVGAGQEIVRFSDDGEPSGTAGKPILNVLQGEGICNTLIIVVRYFGGTLLGTGGLIRAYTKAASMALAGSECLKKTLSRKLGLTVDYHLLGKVQYIIAENEIPVLDTIYEENVRLVILVPHYNIEKIEKLLVESTNGLIEIEPFEDCYAAVFNKETLVFSI